MSKGRPPTHCRESLLIKGIELFNSKGYHATGLSTILQTCQISKGSFYNFFNSKEEYAVEVIEYYQALETDRWALEFAKLEGSHFMRMRQMLEKMLSEYDPSTEKMGCLIANLSGEVGNESPGFRRAIQEATERVIVLISEDMRVCQEEGSVRLDLSPDALAHLIWDIWQGALLRMKVNASLQPLNQCIDLLWNHILPSPLSHSDTQQGA